MTDGELQRLAGYAESLTELAWDVLEDEMDRRHLDLPDEAAPEPRQEMEMRELVTIRQFRDLPEALLARGSLESSRYRMFSGGRKSGSPRLVHFKLHRRHQAQRARRRCGERAATSRRADSRRPLRPAHRTVSAAALSQL